MADMSNEIICEYFIYIRIFRRSMNKRGQIYILAAIVLVIAIWSVVKVVNKVESPEEDNFDFYVENFAGERAYVMDLGYLQGGDPTANLIGNLDNENNLLNTFTKLGFNVGLVMVVYDDRDQQNPWSVVNFLNTPIETDCGGCEGKNVLQSAQGDAGGLSFSFGSGKNFFLKSSDIQNLDSQKYYVKKYGDANEVLIYIDGNEYKFPKPIGKSRRVESLIFKNLDENYIKIVKV